MSDSREPLQKVQLEIGFGVSTPTMPENIMRSRQLLRHILNWVATNPLSFWKFEENGHGAHGVESARKT
jgi:hypothetical protein